MEFNRLVAQTAAKAGRLMLENGAETARVEDTMQRIAAAYGINAHAFVTLTDILVSCGGDLELVRMKGRRRTNLSIVSSVNQLSREICDGKVEIGEALSRLDEIEGTTPYPGYVMLPVRALCCCAFAYINGGGFTDCMNALIAGIIMGICLMALSRGGASSFMYSLIGAAVLTISALTLYRLGLGANVNYSIIGGLTPLFPGLALINAIRDILNSDYICGSARMFDACVTALAVAMGVGAALKVWQIVFGITLF